MLTAKIADFKSRLSSYLQEVRRGGEVLILDRKTPVARVLPVSDTENDLLIRRPRLKGDLRKLKFPPLRQKIDVVKLVRQTRGDR